MDERNVWQIIFDTLQQNGINVYPPAIKDGECKEPYVVLKQAGGNRIYGYSSKRDFYNILLYVPRNSYSILSDFEADVKAILDAPPLFPMIMPTGEKDNDYFDDNLNAHLRILEYYNNVRDRHL